MGLFLRKGKVMNYNVKVTGIGKNAYELYEDCRCLIIFDNNAPEELAEISVLHEEGEIKKDIKVGDTIVLGKNEYKVTAVGTEAMLTLRELGHCTFKFTGNSETEVPGQIEVEGDEYPEVNEGDYIGFK
jgi:PTS system glucitol/sorbitol-specific IIA component